MQRVTLSAPAIRLKLTCCSFVCATQVADSALAVLRSYDTKWSDALSEKCLVWEACRATSAATTLFDPIKIGAYGQNFADGGLLYNNPVQILKQEATKMWPDRFDSSVLVSIGTGSAPGASLEGNLKTIILAMRDIVTGTERAHNDFHKDNREMVQQDRFFRFNVYHGLADIGLDEAEAFGPIASRTQTYLNLAKVQEEMEVCIKKLCQPAIEGLSSQLSTDGT